MLSYSDLGAICALRLEKTCSKIEHRLCSGMMIDRYKACI